MLTDRPDPNRTSIAIVCLALFVIGWGTNVATPFLVLYRDRLGLSESATVTIFTVYVVGIMSSILIAGPVSDRYGRKAVVVPALVLSIIASLTLIAGQDSYAWLLLGRMLYGVVAGTALGVGAAWLQELYGTERSTKAALVTTVVTFGGFGFGPPVSALFAFFQDSPLTWPFLFHAGLSVAVIPFVLSARETVDGENRPPLALRFGVPSELRRWFWLAIPLIAVWVFAFPSTGFALFPVLVSDQIPGHEVTVAALSGLVTAWAALTALPLMKRLSPVRALHVGLIIGIGGYVLGTLAFSTTAWPLVIPAAMALGAASGITTAGVLAKLAELTNPETRGALNSTFYFLAYFGMAMPTLITTLAKATGLTGALITVTAIALAALLITIVRDPFGDASRTSV